MVAAVLHIHGAHGGPLAGRALLGRAVQAWTIPILRTEERAAGGAVPAGLRVAGGWGGHVAGEEGRGLYKRVEKAKH